MPQSKIKFKQKKNTEKMKNKTFFDNYGYFC